MKHYQVIASFVDAATGERIQPGATHPLDDVRAKKLIRSECILPDPVAAPKGASAGGEGGTGGGSADPRARLDGETDKQFNARMKKLDAFDAKVKAAQEAAAAREGVDVREPVPGEAEDVHAARLALLDAAEKKEGGSPLEGGSP